METGEAEIDEMEEEETEAEMEGETEVETEVETAETAEEGTEEEIGEMVVIEGGMLDMAEVIDINNRANSRETVSGSEEVIFISAAKFLWSFVQVLFFSY